MSIRVGHAGKVLRLCDLHRKGGFGGGVVGVLRGGGGGWVVGWGGGGEIRPVNLTCGRIQMKCKVPLVGIMTSQPCDAAETESDRQARPVISDSSRQDDLGHRWAGTTSGNFAYLGNCRARTPLLHSFLRSFATI